MNSLDGLSGIEIRHLAALRAIAEEGTFTGAAVRLGYTQSAVSHQIAALERIVEQRLVERPGGPRPVSLTEAGTLVLGHAEAVLARLRAAAADLAALAGGTAGTLAVGTYQSVGARILPELLVRFRAAWPGVDVRLRESADDEEFLALVACGELDLTVAVLPCEQDGFESVELLHDPYVLLVEADSPLARRRGPPALADLESLPLLGHRNSSCQRRLEAGLRARGLDPAVVFRSDDNGTLQALAAAGLGAALVPRLTVDAADDRVAILPLDGVVAPRVLGLAWHRDRYRSPAAVAFAEEARRLCAELGAPRRRRASTAA